MKKSDQKLTIIYFLSDIIILNISIVSLLIFKYGIGHINKYYTVFLLLYNIIWISIVFLSNTYSMHWRYDLKAKLYIQLRSIIIFTGIISVILILLKDLHFSRFIIYGSICLFILLKIMSGYLLFKVIGKLRSSGRNKRRLLILGAGRIGRRAYKIIQKNFDLGFSVIGFLDDNQKSNPVSEMILGKVNDLENVLSSVNIDEIIIALPLSQIHSIQRAIEISEHYGTRIRLIPDYYHILGRTFSTSHLGDLPLINIREVPLDDLINYSIKRGFDVFFSISVIVLFSPFYLFVSMLLILEKNRSVLYKPVRIGNKGNKFKMYKYRTMDKNDDEVNGTKSTIKYDPRITKLGKILRKYNLDEMPQFFNVLKGNMSVVGPRPHRIWLTENMQNEIEGYMVRHYMKPGITGWAQVNGWRGLLDTKRKKINRTRYDLWYMENWSLWLDIKIIFMTVFSKKTYKDAY